MGLTTLRTRSEFDRVFAKRSRYYRDGLGVYYRFADNDLFRFGMVTPKRFGGAVDRNKFRRRVREILRSNKSLPQGYEVVICVYKPCREIGFDLLSRTLSWAIERVRRQATSRGAGHSVETVRQTSAPVPVTDNQCPKCAVDGAVTGGVSAPPAPPQGRSGISN